MLLLIDADTNIFAVVHKISYQINVQLQALVIRNPLFNFVHQVLYTFGDRD